MKAIDTKQLLPEQQGFTLLELLLAIVIFGMVVSMIYGPYTGTFRMVNVVEPELEIYQKARVAMTRIIEDLESAYSSPSMVVDPESEFESEMIPQFIGEDQEIDGRPADTIQFNSRAHLVFGDAEEDSGEARIRYAIEEDAEAEGLVLLRSDRPGFAGGTEEEEDGGFILCDGLAGVRFTFYGMDGEEYDNWDSSQEEFQDRLPRMIDIVLEFVNGPDPEDTIKFMTSVILPISEES